jgi:hypothetical protein
VSGANAEMIYGHIAFDPLATHDESGSICKSMYALHVDETQEQLTYAWISRDSMLQMVLQSILQSIATYLGFFLPAATDPVFRGGPAISSAATSAADLLNCGGADPDCGKADF